jgi:hypothetical protein
VQLHGKYEEVSVSLSTRIPPKAKTRAEKYQKRYGRLGRKFIGINPDVLLENFFS